MARPNKISVVFTEADKNAVIAKLNEGKNLMPFLVNLTIKERSDLRKMGPKSVDYVRQSLEGAIAFPGEMKANFDVAEMTKDYNLINNLLGVKIICESILESINDTMMAGGIDGIAAADEVYNSLKGSAKGNANVKAMVEKIGERFKAQGNRKPKTTPPTV